MKKRMFGLILVFILASVITGCSSAPRESPLDESKQILTAQEVYCINLAQIIDEQIIDTMNPPGRYIISSLGENVQNIGGFLTKIEQNEDEGEYKSYTLTFNGLNETGELYLITTSSNALPYEIGSFYEFNARDINIYSMQHSGQLIDNDLNKLQLVDCGTLKMSNDE